MTETRRERDCESNLTASVKGRGTLTAEGGPHIIWAITGVSHYIIQVDN